MSLYQLERERNVDELVEMLRRSENPSIRRRAAEIIGGLFESDDVDESELRLESETEHELEPGPETDSDAEVVSVVDVLVTIVKEDENQGVRAAAIDALDHHGQEALEQVVTELSGERLDSPTDWVAARAFAEVLEDEQPELRMVAATGLGQVGDPSVTAALVKRLDDTDARVRTRSAVACGRIGDPRAVEPLESRLEDEPNVEVRKAATEALGRIGTDGALRVLLENADDPDESVRRVVADSLGAFGSVRPVKTLVEYLGDRDESVRRTAMFSMVEILSNAPSQRSHEVREATADQLDAAKAGKVIPPLAEILTDSSGTPQRRNAAWLLGQVVGTRHRDLAREALIDALGSEDGMTAQFAATSLTRLGGSELEADLLELVRDREATEAAKSKALFVLGKIGGETAQAELSEFVDRTESDALRQQAFSALSKLGGIGAGEIP